MPETTAKEQQHGKLISMSAVRSYDKCKAGSPRRRSVLLVRVTADEHRRIHEVTRAAGVAASTYIRRQILDTLPDAQQELSSTRLDI